MLNYYEIGQRVRKFRKACGFSQEELAEKVSISTTHMSHIETGNTKLSLPVLVELSTALCVSTDELLFATTSQHTTAIAEIQSVLDSCSPTETKILADILRNAKIAMDKYM